METSREVILNAISKMTVMELVDFITEAEKRFNVSASATQMVKQVDVVESVVKEQPEKTEFKVILENFGSDKIKVIKVVRSLTKLGLKEAKDLVESVPVVIKDNLSKEEMSVIKKELEEAGATLSIK